MPNEAVARQLSDVIRQCPEPWSACRPSAAAAHFNLGEVFRKTCATQKVLDLLPKDDLLRPLALSLPDQSDAWLALEVKLADVLAGKAQLKDNRERFGLLEVCRLHQRHAAAHLYGDAFTVDAKLADDLNAAHSYNAACFAALAVAGRGTGSDKLGANERTRLRIQAFDWLRADLALWTKRLADGKSQDRQALLQALKHWQEDTDLIAIRDAKALAKLPADEREAF
jgi:hypothetical protein